MTIGCDRQPAGTTTAPSKPDFDTLVKTPEDPPTYAFAEGIEADYPDVTAFMRRFMETCLVGDYSGYRRLVSRSATPESQKRFERVLHALEKLTVEHVELVELPQVPPPCYVVIGNIELREGSRVAIRRQTSSARMAILVFREQGEWRMTFAPSQLQPEMPETEDTSEPAEPEVEYPWDEGIDY